MSSEQFTVEEMIKKIEDMMKDGWKPHYDKLRGSSPNGEVDLTELFIKNQKELASLLRKDKTGVITMKRGEETKQFTKIAYDTFIEKPN